ncbi:MAG: N-acetyltransferase [Nitrosopumilus sp.]|jgi:acetyltransferase-like isoleucine patch superfamily enzyme|nr:N-acetyltransferase [Nitrosopumilus sp.]
MIIHPLADVHSENIGEGTTVWQFSIVLEGAKIGKNSNINCHCFIENNVVIGDNVTVKSGIYIWNGVVIEDDVFLGPNVVFTNDLRPRSKQYVPVQSTIVQKGASVGANSTILAGISIGKYSMTGIGSVITRNVPDYALVYGNPAKVKGWVDENGEELTLEQPDIWVSKGGSRYLYNPSGLQPL